MFNGRFLALAGGNPQVIFATAGSAVRVKVSITNSGPGQVELQSYDSWDYQNQQVTGDPTKGPKVDGGTGAVAVWDSKVALVVALVPGTGLSAFGEWTLEIS